MSTLKEFMLKPWLYLLIVILSLVLKFMTVDYRYFWRDEIYAIHHTSGNSESSLNEKAPINEIKNIDYYRKILRNNSKNLTVASQFKDIWHMTNLNPLHYYLLVFWHRIVGDEDIHYRLFSVFIFLMCLPLLFLLARKIFSSNLASWIAISLFAVSPYFHYYAHEARYNMLLAFTVLCSHYLFLKSIDTNKLKYWIGYIIVSIAVLYTSLTAGVIIIGHFIYVVIFKRKVFISYVVSGLVVIIGYLPWIISIINNRVEISNSLAWHSQAPDEYLNFIKLFCYQIMLVCRTFVAFILIYNWEIAFFFDGISEGVNLTQLILNIVVLLTLIWAGIVAYKNLNHSKFWFILLITLPLLLFFFILDLVRGSVTSAIDRYQLGSYIGVLVLLSFLFFQKISEKKLAYIFFYFIFLTLGGISVTKLVSDKQGLSIGGIFKYPDTAEYISGCSYPLIITNGYDSHRFWGDFMSVVNMIDSDNVDILYADENIKNVKEIISASKKKYSNVIIMMVSDNVKNNLEVQFEGELLKVEKDNLVRLWEIRQIVND